MTNYISNQRVVQMGEGVDWETNAAPTIELSGIDSVTISPSIQTEIVRAYRGGIMPGRDFIEPRHEVDGCSIGGFAIYEQIPYWINLLQFAAEGLTRNWVAPTTAQLDPDLTTLVVGHAGATYGITSPVAKNLSFSWNWGEPLKWSMDLMGYNVVDDALVALAETATASLTYITACQATTYIDIVTKLGDTEATNVMSGNININPNRKYLRRSGSCYPAGVYDSPYWDVTGNLILEADAASIALADAVAAGGTRQMIRVAFASGGLSLTFDIAALLRVPSLLKDEDGLEVVDLQFELIEEGDFTSAPTGEMDGTFEITSVTTDADLWA